MIEKTVVAALNKPEVNISEIHRVTGLSRPFLNWIRDGESPRNASKLFRLLDYLVDKNLVDDDEGGTENSRASTQEAAS